MPAVVIAERCIGCEICERRCPTDAFAMVDLPEPVAVLGRRVRRTVVVKYPDECWHCGVCRLDCPTDAIYYEFPEDMIRGRTWNPAEAL
ncbi:MAG: 4Fe-4S binding protein [Chloroflexota bacterium]|nr:4Fe-4S binding protein [Chloroflexota bacterium]